MRQQHNLKITFDMAKDTILVIDDNRTHDFAEGTTYDNTDCHVENVSTHGKLFEFI